MDSSEQRCSTKFRLFLLSIVIAFSTMAAISIQVPAFSTLDIVRVSFKNTSNTAGVNEIRYGVWSACLQRSTNEVNACDAFSPCTPSDALRICSPIQHAYESRVGPTNGTSGSFVLKASWTKALPVIPAQAILSTTVFITVLFNLLFNLVYFGALLTGFISSLFQAVLYYHIKYGTKQFNGTLGVKVNSGPGAALIVLAFLLLIPDFVMNCMDHKVRKRARAARLRRMLNAIRLPVLPIHRARAAASESTQSVSLPKSPAAAHKKSEIQRALTTYVEEGNFECPICYEEEYFDRRRESLRMESSTLPCKHIFCTRCITRALGNAERCPLCNTKCTVADLRSVNLKHKKHNELPVGPPSKALPIWCRVLNFICDLLPDPWY